MRRRLAIASFLLLLGAGTGALAQPPDGEAEPAAAEVEPAEAPAEAEPTEMTPEQRAEYAAALRQLVHDVRDRALESIQAKIEAKQEQKLDRIAAFLSVIALLGALLLFLPLFLRKKYPGKMGILVKYSALAALLFYLAVNLFAVVLIFMRVTQSVAGEYTNPQVRLVSSTFDLIEDKADEMAEIGPLLIEPTLQELRGESDSSVLVIMLENVQKLKNDVQVFTAIGRFAGKLDWLFGMLPVLFTGLALLLFARMARPTLAEIIRLPERAAQGQRGAARQAIRFTLRNVWAETKATFLVIAVLLGLTFLAGGLLGFVLEPAIEIFMAYLSVAFLYIQVDANASSFWILFSLMGALLFLVLNLAVTILSTVFFLAKAQKIFQSRFRAGVPLGAHRRFWTIGALSAVWAQVLPVLYITVAVRAIGWFVEKSVDKYIDPADPSQSNWAFILASGPALFLVTFLVVFWIGRGIAALGFLARYRVDGQGYAGWTAAEDAFISAGRPGA